MIPDKSIIYVSINIDHDHPLRKVVTEHMDPLPDLDLNRITRLVGADVRRYFRDIVDGTIDPLPSDLSGVNGLVVGCSGHSVNLDKGDLQPWQKRVIDFVREAILEHDVPYLGLCGGGQIGFVALGGEVKANPANVGTFSDSAGSIVIGPTALTLTEKGKRDPIFKGCSDRIVMAAIHTDYMATMPVEHQCDELAHGARLCNQVVGYKKKVRLFGVHPEISQEFLNDTMRPVLDQGAFAVADRRDVDGAFYNINPTSNDNKRIIENFIYGICADHYAERLLETPVPDAFGG